MARCGGGPRASCILDRQICDGNTDCPLGDDEVGLETSDGVHLHCNQTRAQCRLYQSRSPAGPFLAGLQCEGGDCVEEERWCDQHCDCPPHCEDQQHCQAWLCPPGHFKCQQSGLCLSPGQVCDGRQDCGESDGSDEHDCPCEEPSHFWGLNMKLIRDLGRKCLINPETASGIKSVQIDRVRSGGVSLLTIFSTFLLQENC